MNWGDTSLGGRDRQFPDTTWDMVARIHAPGTPERRAGLEILCRRYWKPIYFFVRIAWAKSNEDAKDLTQAFLAWLVAGDAITRFAPEKGSFRGYLKVLLGRFVKDQNEALHALKRGGGVRVLPLDELSSVDGLIADPKATDPGKEFDRTWAMSLAQNAVDRVRERFHATGREAQFRVYEEYDLLPSPDRPTYASVAQKLGLKESDVRNYLFAVRQEVLAEIRVELAKTVTGSKELEDEWDALFGE
jgi:RNA polymerase sigma-70 factor (ECF subfamily)